MKPGLLFIMKRHKNKNNSLNNSRINVKTSSSVSDRMILMRIFKLFKPHTKKIVLMLVCMLIYTLINLVIPLLSKKLMDDGLIQKNFSVVTIYSLLILLLTVLGQASSMLETKYSSYLSTIFPYQLNEEAFKKTIRLKMEYLNGTNFAEIMSNISMDISNISSLLNRQSFILIMQIFSIVGGLIGLLLINWQLSLIVLGIIPLRYFIVKRLAKNRKKLFEEYMEVSREYSAWYGDTLGGIKEIKLLGIERIKIGEFIQKQRKIIKKNIKMFFQDKINQSSEDIVLAFFSAIIYILGAYLIFKGRMTIGGLFAFSTYSLKVTAPLSSILGIGYSYSNVIPSAKRFFEFMDMESENKKIEKVRLNENFSVNNIKFEKVSFSYKNGEKILKDISMKIQDKEKVAIVGINGAGKSTIFNLLLRLYTPDEGKITINGIDINDIKLLDYRKLISVVSQDFYLFNRTVKENIDFRNRIGDKDIYNAIEKSGALSFIGNLDDRLNGMVGRNGVRLSGGERQKLALARAIACKSKIILLDEITSNVDIESEGLINNMLMDQFREETLFIISHRPKVLEYMDKIIVLENGVIKDIGTYEELDEKGVLLAYTNNNAEYKKSIP